MTLAFNLHVIMKRHALGASWANRRIKAIRFGFIRLAGWVIDHAHQLQIRVNAGHPPSAGSLAHEGRSYHGSSTPEPDALIPSSHTLARHAGPLSPERRRTP